MRVSERDFPFLDKSCWVPELVLSEPLRKFHKQLPRLGQLALRRRSCKELIAQAERHAVDKIKPPNEGKTDL